VGGDALPVSYAPRLSKFRQAAVVVLCSEADPSSLEGAVIGENGGFRSIRVFSMDWRRAKRNSRSALTRHFA
jgi:hypothetical protein